MINQLESINRLLASVATLRIGYRANKKDVADYYRTHYVVPVGDSFSDTLGFALQLGLTDSDEKTISLSKLGQRYLELGTPKINTYRLEPNRAQRKLINEIIFSINRLADRIRKILAKFISDQAGVLSIAKKDAITTDPGMLGFLLQSGFFVEKGERIFVSPQYAKLPHGIAPVLSLEEFKRLQKARDVLALKAEKFVLRYERERLQLLGAQEQSGEIEHAAIKNVAAGYDVASFSGAQSKEHDRFIEVKAGSKERIRFFFTRNEFVVAEAMKEKYWIYYVCIKDGKPCKIVMHNNPLESIMKNHLFHHRTEVYEIFEA